MGGEAKIRKLNAYKAAESGADVPISIDTTIRLSRMWHEWQGAEQAVSAAHQISEAKKMAYVDNLTTVVEALDLGVPVLKSFPDNTQRITIEVDFKARVLRLPKPEPAPQTEADVDDSQAGAASPSGAKSDAVKGDVAAATDSSDDAARSNVNDSASRDSEALSSGGQVASRQSEDGAGEGSTSHATA